MECQKPKMDDAMDFLRARKNPADIIDPRTIEWDEEPILCVDYFGNNEKEFLCSVSGKYLGYLYRCAFGEDRPKENSLRVDSVPITFLSKSKDTNFYILGRKDG